MIPKLRDYAVKAWDKSRPYLLAAVEYIHLKIHQHKFLQGLVVGLLVGYFI